MQSRSTQQQTARSRHNAFTFIEVVAAVALLAIMLSSVLVLMNQFIGAVGDMRLRREAFELARSNMETLLSETKLPDIYEYGESETDPDIRWQTVVEPFYEPYKGRMWIRAVCSASFFNSKDEEENIELEHWITNLTAAQIRQILAQQQVEDAYLDLLQEGEYNDIQLATIAYLEQEGLDVEAYKAFLERQRRQKLEYLDKNEMRGYDDYVEQLAEEENDFLEDLGMDFDAYNDFAATYVPPAPQNQSDSSDLPDSESPDEYTPDEPETRNDPESTNNSEGPDGNKPSKKQQPSQSGDPSVDWDKIPKEFWPILKAVGLEPPAQ